MPLKHILGADHVVVTVRDLDAAAAQWKKLGFTLSPRGTHSGRDADHVQVQEQRWHRTGAHGQL